ncbi:MAG: geranylgeranyl reductase family protein [Bacteroidales bacterium]|nr:geranylgeranyl reductase family protein [Bacteroidales bacterium]
MATYEFDLLIVGAGPAGCTLALNLAGTGIRIAMLEKDVFPRHKICGDALSGKVLNVMKRIPGNVYERFINEVDKIPSWGIRFTAPNHHFADVPFLLNRDEGQPAPGYICRRNDFDNFMFERLKEHPDIQIIEGEKIELVISDPDQVVAKTQNHEYRGKVIAGADGVHSIVRKSQQNNLVDKKHFCLGIRGYFENVGDLHPENFIELIFLKRLLPGYFWIFPSTGGLVNAGFGMMQNRISECRENLSQILKDIISNDPLIAPRFSKARIVGKAEAHTLPLGTYKFNQFGHRYILLGDAAFLVDPFSGEGIGNAMASGEIAAAILKQNFINNDFSADSLKPYDTRLRRRFSQEFRTMSVIQHLAHSAGLFNLVVDKASKNRAVSELLTAMYSNDNIRKKLTRPGFYMRLLFS